jgi:hypothetical protein
MSWGAILYTREPKSLATPLRERVTEDIWAYEGQ